MPQLNFKIIGEGRPVVILHGLFGMLDNWQSFAKRLAEHGYMAILVDQRDHGKSPFTNEFDYNLLAEDLNKFLEEQWIFKTILLGHSMGGKTAMKFTLEHEEKVEKLLVIDISPERYEGGHENVFKAIFSVDLKNSSNRENIYHQLKSWLNDDESTIQFLMKNLSRKKEGGYEWKFNIENIYKNYHNILSEIEADHECLTDALFIRGERSEYIKDQSWLKIKRLFPNSKLVTISKAGHWIHAEKQEELLSEVMEFLSLA